MSINLHAQTLEEARRLYAEKKYKEAATMYYHLYRFNEAAEAYQKQMEVLVQEKHPEAAEALKPLLIRAERAARMVFRCENVQIIDSIVVDKPHFLTAYLMGEEAGTLEKTQNTFIHENQLKNRRYFGKPDDKGLSRLNMQVKIQDEWSDTKLLNLPVDTLGEDNFPFVMPDGMTIYYASTGNESIGGYDIFVSRYNLNNDTYLTPNQIGMPFNSIYNDYMLAIDEANNVGYFATDRFQPEDKVIVYTFIPNEAYIPIENADTLTLIERAKISSLQDSWAPNTNYQAYLQKIRTNIERERQIVKRDFTFVINDNIVYYNLNDFDSDAAKKSFQQSKEIQEAIKALEDFLDARRKEYAQGDVAKKQSLTPLILTNEKRLEELYGNYRKAVIEVRNIEINYLRQNSKTGTGIIN
jgi:hypothetical protein